MSRRGSPFTKHSMPHALEAIREAYPEEYNKYDQAYLDDVTNEEVLAMIAYYSPFHYVADGNTDVAGHFRICVGTQDRDTATTVSATLALFLQNQGIDAVYDLFWNQIHTDADLDGAFEAWVDSICLA